MGELFHLGDWMQRMDEKSLRKMEMGLRGENLRNQALLRVESTSQLCHCDISVWIWNRDPNLTFAQPNNEIVLLERLCKTGLWNVIRDTGCEMEEVENAGVRVG
jgi:hypothetical protein